MFRYVDRQSFDQTRRTPGLIKVFDAKLLLFYSAARSLSSMFEYQPRVLFSVLK